MSGNTHTHTEEEKKRKKTKWAFCVAEMQKIQQEKEMSFLACGNGGRERCLPVPGKPKPLTYQQRVAEGMARVVLLSLQC